ncbi:MAG: DNA alkylation repair protein [Myxococcota bacterium]
MPEPFKERINPAAVKTLAAGLRAGTPSFPADAFIQDAAAGLASLALKDRVRKVSRALASRLPSDWSSALQVMIRGMGPPLPDDRNLTGGFLYWPMLQVVEDHGLAHPDASLAALGEMTRRFSAEFAVRPYLLKHPDKAWAQMNRWTESDDLHVRRLASEGSRPRLPWGIRLPPSIQDPSRNLALLHKLKDDPEAYVRRSVANHLNDVSRDHPQRAVETATQWMQTPARRQMVRHGLRTLLKSGDPGALALMGFSPPKLKTTSLTVSPLTLTLGQTLTLTAHIVSTKSSDQSLMVDVAIGFLRKNGTLSDKVFKGTTRTLKKGETWNWEKSLPLRAVTTRRHYPGAHRVRLLINGAPQGEATFTLVC